MTDNNTNDEKYNRKILKEKFKDGKRPSGQNFAALIDSMINIIDDNLVKNSQYGLVLYPTSDDLIALTLKTSCTAEAAWSIKVENNDDESVNLNLIDHNGNTALLVKGNTFLGIRNLSPQYPLDINGDTRIKGTLIIASSTDNTTPAQAIQIKQVAASNSSDAGLQFIDGQGKTIFFLGADGKIGMNTALPAYALDVIGDTHIKGTLSISPLADNTAAAQTVQIKQVAASDSSDAGLQFIDGQGKAIFFLGADGKIGMNTALPAYALDVIGDTHIKGTLSISPSADDTATAQTLQIKQVAASNNSDAGLQFIDGQGKTMLFLGINGKIGNANTQPKNELDINGTLSATQLVGNLDPNNFNGQIPADNSWYDIATDLTEFDAFELIAQAWYEESGAKKIYWAIWDHILLSTMTLDASYPLDSESKFIKYRKTLINDRMTLQLCSSVDESGSICKVNYNLLKRN